MWRKLRFQEGCWVASFCVQINSLGAFPLLVPPKVWGKGRKGELAGCPSSGLPYLSDQPSFSLPFSLTALASAPVSSLQFAGRKKSLVLLGVGLY